MEKKILGAMAMISTMTMATPAHAGWSWNPISDVRNAYRATAGVRHAIGHDATKLYHVAGVHSGLMAIDHFGRAIGNLGGAVNHTVRWAGDAALHGVFSKQAKAQFLDADRDTFGVFTEATRGVGRVAETAVDTADAAWHHKGQVAAFAVAGAPGLLLATNRTRAATLRMTGEVLNVAGTTIAGGVTHGVEGEVHNFVAAVAPHGPNKVAATGSPSSEAAYLRMMIARDQKTLTSEEADRDPSKATRANIARLKKVVGQERLDLLFAEHPNTDRTKLANFFKWLGDHPNETVQQFESGVRYEAARDGAKTSPKKTSSHKRAGLSLD